MSENDSQIVNDGGNGGAGGFPADTNTTNAVPAPESNAERVSTDTPTPVPDKPNFAPIESQEEFDKRIGQRLAKEREKYADYDEVKEAADKYKEYLDSQKDEQTKLTEERDRLLAELQQAREDAETSKLNELRAEIADAKGLTLKQAKRLTGKTREELEADADDLLESFPTPKTPTRSTSTRPIPTGTSDPEKESEHKSFDATKKADEIFRRNFM